MCSETLHGKNTKSDHEVKVEIEINRASISIDPYVCAIKIKDCLSKQD